MKSKIFPLLFTLGSLIFFEALNAQVEVGARLGLNLSNIVVKDQDGDLRQGSKATPGIHAGLTFDIPVAQDFYVQPGALLSVKGSKIMGDTYEYIYNDSYFGGDYTIYNAYYLEVPVNILFKPYTGTGNGRLVVGAGPYVAYGLGGKWKDNYNGNITTGKLEFINDWNDESSSTNTYTYGKKVDLGLNLLAGYEFSNRFSVQVNGQLGLANLEPLDGGQKPTASLKNTVFGVSVGYKF